MVSTPYFVPRNTVACSTCGFAGPRLLGELTHTDANAASRCACSPLVIQDGRIVTSSSTNASTTIAPGRMELPAAAAIFATALWAAVAAARAAVFTT